MLLQLDTNKYVYWNSKLNHRIRLFMNGNIDRRIVDNNKEGRMIFAAFQFQSTDFIIDFLKFYFIYYSDMCL